MPDLVTLAWIIGSLNPLSAILVGPALGGWLTRRGHTATAVRLQGAGWLTLALAQVAFLTFGWISGLGGFRWAQALMIPAAAANFAAWLMARRDAGRLRDAIRDAAARDPIDTMMQAIHNAEQAGLVRVRNRIDLSPDIPTTGPLTARSMRLTKLDADGKPTGTPIDITGTASIDLEYPLSVPDRAHERMEPSTPVEEPVEQAHRVPGTWPPVVCKCPEGLDGHREQCSGQCFGGHLSAPERCAEQAGHEGECAP